MRREEGKQPAPPKRSFPLGWGILLGLVVVLAASIAAGVLFIRSHPERFLPAGLAAGLEEAHRLLNGNQEKFNWDEVQEIRSQLQALESLSQIRPLTPALAGNIQWFLGTLREIIQQGNLEPGELEKVRHYLTQTQQEAVRKKSLPAPKP